MFKKEMMIHSISKKILKKSVFPKKKAKKIRIFENALNEDLSDEEMPLCFKEMIHYLWGGSPSRLSVEGVFIHKSPPKSLLHLRRVYEEEGRVDLEKHSDAVLTSNLLKSFLDDLSPPLIVPEVKKSLFYISKQTEDQDALERMNEALQKLPQINFTVLKQLVFLIRMVVKLQNMDHDTHAVLLSETVGPCAFQEYEDPDRARAIHIFKTLLVQYPFFFEGRESKVTKIPQTVSEIVLPMYSGEKTDYVQEEEEDIEMDQGNVRSSLMHAQAYLDSEEMSKQIASLLLKSSVSLLFNPQARGYVSDKYEVEMPEEGYVPLHLLSSLQVEETISERRNRSMTMPTRGPLETSAHTPHPLRTPARRTPMSSPTRAGPSRSVQTPPSNNHAGITLMQKRHSLPVNTRPSPCLSSQDESLSPDASSTSPFTSPSDSLPSLSLDLHLRGHAVDTVKKHRSWRSNAKKLSGIFSSGQKRKSVSSIGDTLRTTERGVEATKNESNPETVSDGGFSFTPTGKIPKYNIRNRSRPKNDAKKRSLDPDRPNPKSNFKQRSLEIRKKSSDPKQQRILPEINDGGEITSESQNRKIKQPEPIVTSRKIKNPEPSLGQSENNRKKELQEGSNSQLSEESEDERWVEGNEGGILKKEEGSLEEGKQQQQGREMGGQKNNI